MAKTARERHGSAGRPEEGSFQEEATSAPEAQLAVLAVVTGLGALAALAGAVEMVRRPIGPDGRPLRRTRGEFRGRAARGASEKPSAAPSIGPAPRSVRRSRA